MRFSCEFIYLFLYIYYICDFGMCVLGGMTLLLMVNLNCSQDILIMCISHDTLLL